MKNKKTIITIGVIILILAGLAIFLNLLKTEPETYQELGYKPINQNNIIGTWEAISEQFSFSESVNTNLENYEITFNNNNTYSSLTYNISDSGYYKLKDNRIYFYEKEEYMNLEGNFFQAQGWIKNNQLTLIFPQFPKAVVYEKIR